MHGASRESFAAARAELDGLTDASALAAAADEILAVAGVLAREPRLRRSLSDPSRSGEERSALLLGLVGDQIGATARQLLGTLLSGRWSSPSELRDAVDRLGVETLIVAADRAGELGEVEDELFRFGQIVAGDPQLAAAVGDSTAPIERRDQLVDWLLAGEPSGQPAEARSTKVKPVTMVLAKQALRGFSGRSFAGALSRLVELAAEQRDRSVAYVTVAEALSDAEEERLGTVLAERYGREVAVKVTVDPSVLGGARVRIGSDLYDGTVSRRLADARNALASR
jgi:F-type H+-transporting ATPase subunit delta